MERSKLAIDWGYLFAPFRFSLLEAPPDASCQFLLLEFIFFHFYSFSMLTPWSSASLLHPVKSYPSLDILALLWRFYICWWWSLAIQWSSSHPEAFLWGECERNRRKSPKPGSLTIQLGRRLNVLGKRLKTTYNLVQFNPAYLLSTFSVLGTVLGTGVKVMKKIDMDWSWVIGNLSSNLGYFLEWKWALLIIMLSVLVSCCHNNAA